MSKSLVTLLQIAAAIRHKECSAVEITQDYLQKITAHDGTIKSFISVDTEGALGAAKEIDRRLKNKEQLGPLAGVPLGIKDVLCTAHWPTTAGSKALQGWRPNYDATSVAKLKAADAVILGKNNCDEFAMGSSTEFSAFGPTHNPVDARLVPGGSSGGSAAAVAAGLCAASVGTDTGGSVRQPAAFCGTVGFKPTYGRISRYGLIAMASSLDTVGFLTKTVADAAALLEVTSGLDEHDSTSADRPAPTIDEALQSLDLKKIKFGLIKQCLADDLEKDLAHNFNQACQTIAKHGGQIKEISLPSLDYALAVYYIIMPAEVSANLARFDGVRYGPDKTSAKTFAEQIKQWRGQHLGPEVQRRILLGTYVLSAGYQDAFYRTALAARQQISQEIDQALQQVDVLITPTTPTTAFAIGSKVNDPLAMYLGDLFTVPANIAGVPAISLPLPNPALPIGLQLMGKWWQEARLLQIANMVEKLWN